MYVLIVTYSETQTIDSNLALSQIPLGLLPSEFSKLSKPNYPKNCTKFEPALVCILSEEF